MNWNDSVHILCENEWKVIKKNRIYILIKKQICRAISNNYIGFKKFCILMLLSTYFLKIQQHAANCDCSCRQLILIVYVDN